MALLSLLPAMASAQKVTITVTNPVEEQREQLVEAPLDSVKARLGLAEGDLFVVKNASRQQVPYQVSYDGKLIIDASVRPCGTTTYTVSRGVPETFPTWVQGKMYRVRKDDIAWENDRGAYRVYGPALQKTGERSFGIDVWTKNTPDLVVSDRYYKDMEGNITGYADSKNGKKDDYIDLHTSFHLDHGNGLDCYSVGPSLGCGAPALMIGDSLVLPYCYKTYKILDNGPLRFTVELTFNPTKIGDDDNVIEHRIISLDKGSNFNKMTVWYENLTKPRDLAAGVVLHGTDDVVVGKNFVQYADPTDQPNCYGYQLYVGAVFPEGAQTKILSVKHPHDGIYGHAVGIKKGLKNNERYTYYFGSAWSQYDVRTQAEWQLRVNEMLSAAEAPFMYTLK